MAKISLARENDKGKTTSVVLVLLTSCLIGGFGGIPFGAILSAIMQGVFKNSSAFVMYGSFGIPIILGMIIVFFYVKKDMDTKDHTRCSNCFTKMQPMTETDSLFYIPAEGDEQYDNPFQYLTKNMVKVANINEIPAKKRGCYVCIYKCDNCNKRIIRIADFKLSFGTCDWKNSYYFDLSEFMQAKEQADFNQTYF